MRFECEHPAGVSGVTYKVERRFAPHTPYVFVTNAKGREFTDTGIPSGSAEVTYRVTAQTSTKDGLAGGATIRFGSNNQAVIFSEVGGPAGSKQTG